MSGQRPGSYPSPNAVQVASGVPFYQQSSSASAQDVPAMQELSAELSRALNSNMQQEDEGVMQQQLGGSIPELDLQQQLAQDAMGQLGGVQEYDDEEDEVSDGGTTHKRKKQKLSNDDKRQKNTRACDECRRKKVKCESEAGQELGIEACLACKKSGLQCQFSRVPQKRGPSKGYISKLDERLQNVENAIREYVPQAAHRIGRPEAGDSSYDGVFSDGTPQAQPGASTDGHLDYIGNGDPQGFWNHMTRLPTQMPDLAAMKAVSSQDLDESVLSQCYKLIQAILPILPADPSTQRRMLAQVSSVTRAAFANALNLFVRSMGEDGASITQVDLKTASQLCLEADFEPPSSTKTLILIQSYMLLCLAAEELGPVFAHSGSATSSQKLLSQANNLALGISIHRLPNPKELIAGHGDTESKIARRLFVSLYILDRWLAIGHASPFRVNMPDDRLVLLAEDQQVLGQQCYQMARICTVLTQVGKTLPRILITSGSALDPLSDADRRNYMADMVQSILDRVTDDFNSFVAGLPVLQAAFWHAELLVNRLKPIADYSMMTEKTVRLLEMLADAKATPLFHHFAALCGLSIAELALHQPNNKAITSSAATLTQILSTRSLRDGSWEQTIANLVNAATSGQQDTMAGLHNLADAAVTGSAIQALQQADGFDMARLIGDGYLNPLVPKQ